MRAARARASSPLKNPHQRRRPSNDGGPFRDSSCQDDNTSRSFRQAVLQRDSSLRDSDASRRFCQDGFRQDNFRQDGFRQDGSRRNSPRSAKNSFAQIFFLCLSSCVGLAGCAIDEPILSGLQQASTQQKPVTKKSDDLKPSSPGKAAVSRNASPLPYKIDFDTAAFMNCPGDVSPNDPIFFFLKFGAYASGVKLSDDVRKKLSEISSVEKKQKFLESQPLITARAQLSLSSTGYPARIARIGGGGIVNVMPLHHPQVTKNLSRDGVSYTLADGRLVELEFPYPGGAFAGFPSQLRKFSVYLTYNKGSDMRPVSPGKGLYHGRLFKPDFSEDYMTALTERDLKSDKPAGKWTCPEKLRFAVHREPQFTRNYYTQNRKWFNSKKLTLETECKETADIFKSANEKQAEYEKQLVEIVANPDVFFYGRPLQFSKDSSGDIQGALLDSRCIASKNFQHSCYGQVRRVEFDKSKCIEGSKDKACPAYLSICIKRRSS